MLNLSHSYVGLCDAGAVGSAMDSAMDSAIDSATSCRKTRGSTAREHSMARYQLSASYGDFRVRDVHG